jgi:hypothetical protein
MPPTWTQATMDTGCSSTQGNLLVTQYADAEPLVFAQCEQYTYMQMIGAPRSPVPALFVSNSSQSFRQPIQQNFQNLLPPTYLDYPLGYSTYLEGQSFADASKGLNPCLVSPYTSYPVTCEHVPVKFFPAGSEGYRHTFMSSETPYLHCMYTDVVSGSSYGGLSSKSGTCSSVWDYSESTTDRSAAQGGGRKAQKKMGIIRSSRDGTRSRRVQCFPSKRINCPIEVLGGHCAQSFARVEHLRRHIQSVHSGFSVSCKVPRCTKSFSRSDNLYDHYCTHLDVEKPGRNRRLSLYELGQILGSRDIGIFRILQRRMERPRKPTRRRRHKS